MPLVDAALAFALTMMGLATVATILIEIVHRILQLRARGLRKVVTQFYEAELRPAIAKMLIRKYKATSDVATSDQELDALSADELLALSRKVVQGEVDRLGGEVLSKLLENPLAAGTAGIVPMRRLTKLDTTEILQRLGRTEAFESLKAQTEAEIGRAVDRIAVRYDEYSAAASDFFRRRAQIMSILAGVVLAFGANIDAYRIFKSYIEDPSLSEGVIAEQESLIVEWQKVQGELEATLARAEGAAAQGDVGNEQAKAQGDVLEGIRDRVEVFNKGLDDLQVKGLAFGYAIAPASIRADTWRSVPKELADGNREVWQWVLRVLASGLLIGLGGPFWYDVVMRLSQARQMLRGGRPGAPAQAPAGGDQQRREANQGDVSAFIRDRTLKIG